MGVDCEVAVVGGGIVGLATAYAIGRRSPGTRVVVLEKEPRPAAHQTGRNSGVIHSGLYYRPGSLKARYAVRGAREMVAFCREYGVPHEVTGKLVVAVDRAELPRLHALAQRGRDNGIPLRELGATQIADYEPRVAGVGALHVETTGICDYAAAAERMAELAGERYGMRLRTGSAVEAVAVRPDGVTVVTGLAELRARVLVNCAGLQSDRVALMAGYRPPVRILPFRGEFFELAKERRELVRGLVYPVPDPALPFLGVHLTRDVHGGVHVGPNAVPALAREGYGWTTARPRDLAEEAAWPGTWRLARRHWRAELAELHHSLSKRAFTRAVRRLLPEIAAEDLVPAPAGVRAQAVTRDGALLDDFAFGEQERAVHVLNAPSPAATASLPIGREVADRALAALAALEGR
ncbi:L-2-hydroxyglutarate oxidase [Phaeacidiphilus oryzae]|uniref:L-2-hydroxyglutarate oxidase n=1 Tax=Phaeacidiphilus oryzae TaxID=348818 RepID=UPI00055A997B|nr:L-2-hydroxyglutarate oxidase [Phaeacidiphilus oryzae]